MVDQSTHEIWSA